MPKSTLHRMRRNPYYADYVRRNGVRHEGNHAPLVSQELFDEVQNLLDARNNTAGEKRRVHQHYLKGSVLCAPRGARLCITKAVNRARQ